MKIAAIVPYLHPIGFLEIGNVMTARGHDYTLYAKNAPVGARVSKWVEYYGKFLGWEEANSTFEADVVLIGHPDTLSVLEDPGITISGKVYIMVTAAGLGVYLEKYKEYEAKGYSMILNTRMYSKDFPNAELCEGGVNTSIFTPKTIRVGYYAGRGTHKGEYHIVGSLKDIKHVIPVPIQGLDTPDLVKAYKGLDYFVCSETIAGWSNMAAEAIACGIPVVSDSKNTDLFSDKVINVKDLRAFFENPMGDFSWEKVCDRLMEIWSKQ